MIIFNFHKMNRCPLLNDDICKTCGIQYERSAEEPEQCLLREMEDQEPQTIKTVLISCTILL